MTNVSFTRIHDTYVFDCTGHTEYATLGKDILCSAVSVLCYTLGAYTEGLYLGGIVKKYHSSFSEGSVHISLCFSEDVDEKRYLEAIEAILHGFCMLSECYPDYVSADM